MKQMFSICRESQQTRSRSASRGAPEHPVRHAALWAILKGELSSLSLYRVHFKWKDKEVELMAKSLDLTHP
ncbi:MAG TPA: hypothetical protein VMV03_06765, partial [Spirochaetia bacterium]|nr:hypothetical protein [Spirochaetia bacterium]